jgi:hypothetical protein
MHKIKTRILAARMAGIMEFILYRDQHGFCRYRSILPILEAIHDAEKTDIHLQLLSIDLKDVFDTIALIAGNRTWLYRLPQSQK